MEQPRQAQRFRGQLPSRFRIIRILPLLYLLNPARSKLAGFSFAVQSLNIRDVLGASCGSFIG
jgi:hypothetical protein